MHTILVLTDFSEASTYAASYACILARQLDASNIVLYHSYKDVVTPGESVVYAGDERSLHQAATDALLEQVASLSEQVPEGCTLRHVADTKTLEEINTLTEDEKAELIVMGTTGKGKIESLVAGSNAITVCETSDVPVVLVPSHVAMGPVSGIVFACDMKETANKLPKDCIKKIVREFHVPLSILHIGKGRSKEAGLIDEWLGRHNPEYHEIENEDIGKGILDFAGRTPASLILLVAKKHGFPAGLFHKSITRQLAFQSTIPLIVIKENEQPVPVMPLLEI